MPAYVSVSYVFEKESLSSEFVKQFYQSLFVNRVGFEKVFPWGCPPDMLLADIISWNQAKLDANFSLGFSDDVSLNYRQVLLSGSPFSECRVFIHNLFDSIVMHMIFPECEATAESLAFVQDVSASVWRRMKPEFIQTVCEMGDPVSLEEFRSGELPACTFFCFIKSKPAGHKLEAYDLSEVENGYLIKANRP